jgi:hypothetical protein
MVEDLYASPSRTLVCRECAPGQDRAERKLRAKRGKISELDRESDIRPFVGVIARKRFGWGSRGNQEI